MKIGNDVERLSEMFGKGSKNDPAHTFGIDGERLTKRTKNHDRAAISRTQTVSTFLQV